MRAKFCGQMLTVAVVAIAASTVAQAGYVDTLTSTPGLISYWDLNETGGTTAADQVTSDSIDGDNAGAYLGTGFNVGDVGPRPDAGYPGFAADNYATGFNKTDGQLQMPNFTGYAGMTDVTLTAWFKIDNGGVDNHIGGLQTTDGTRYVFDTHNYANNLMTFVKRSDASQINAPIGTFGSAADWHFLAITYQDGLVSKSYLDGAEVGGGSKTEAMGLFPAQAMVFGQDIGYAPRALGGKLDELAFFNRALTGAEVTTLWQAATNAPPPPEPGETATAPFRQTATNLGGLRNHWTLDDATGNTAIDLVAGNNGTYVNLSGDPVNLAQPALTPTDGTPGMPADNKSVQFVWNTGGNYMETEDGQKLGNPDTGTAFADGVNQLSMSFWFNNNYNGQGYVAGFAKVSGSGRYVFSAYSPDDKNLYFYTKADNDVQLNTPAIPIDPSIAESTWHHVVQVWDGTEKNLRVYIDGKEKFNGVNSAMSENISIPDGFYLGRDVPGNTRNLGGYIDEVMLFDQALSADEVFELYDSAFFVPEPSSAAMLIFGLCCLLFAGRQSKRGEN